MNNLLEIATSFFELEQWSFGKDDKDSVLQMGYQGESSKFLCYMRLIEEPQQVVFYSVSPINVPEEKRDIAAKFLTWCNFGLIIGNFEMDFTDGEIRYKTSLDVQDAELSQALLRRLVYPNVIMIDQYMPKILALVYGDVTFEQAIS